jgi:hypothetical protein
VRVLERERELERSICTIPTISVYYYYLSKCLGFFLWTKGLQSSDPLFWWVSKWTHYSDGWCCYSDGWPQYFDGWSHYSDGWYPQPPNSSELKTSLMNRQVVVKISLSYWSFHRRWLTGSQSPILNYQVAWLLAYRHRSFIDMETHPLIIWPHYMKLKFMGGWVGWFFDGNLLPFIWLHMKLGLR